MTQEELYDLATECDVENNYQHERSCEYCQAWKLWVERDEAQRERTEQRKLNNKINELAVELSACYNITRADAQHIIKMTMEAFNA